MRHSVVSASLLAKGLEKGSESFKIMLYLSSLIISTTLKLYLAWRGSMAVAAVKKSSIIHTPEGVCYS